MVRVVIRGWLSCAICNIEPWLSFSVFCFLQTLLLDRLLSRVSYVLIFVIRKNEIFISVIRTWSSIIFFPFVNSDRDDPCATLQSGFFCSFDAPFSERYKIDLISKETQNSFSDSLGFNNTILDFLKERHPKLVRNLYHGNHDVILTQRLGTKTPVVNTKWP